MISVLNHRQQLSGNKFKFYLVGFLLCLSQFSSAQIFEANKYNRDFFDVDKPEKDFLTVTLVLPFYLDVLQAGSVNFESESFKSRSIGFDYYQGLKLAFDSLTNFGLRTKINIVDSEKPGLSYSSADVAQMLNESDAIIGPIVPDKFLQASVFTQINPIPTFSPLSPQDLLRFNNPYLISLTPTLKHHAWAMAKHIYKNAKGKSVLIIENPSSKNNKLNKVLTEYLDSIKVKYTRVYIKQDNPSFSMLEKGIKEAMNEPVIINTSLDSKYLNTFFQYLSTDSTLSMSLYTHPNIDKLEGFDFSRLMAYKTYTTSSFFYDEDNPEFSSLYRHYIETYHQYPNEQALKGFQFGWFLGRLFLKYNTNYFKNLNDDNSNVFPKYSFLIENFMLHNAHVEVLQWKNFNMLPEVDE
jgi:hypothetical protein